MHEALQSDQERLVQRLDARRDGLRNGLALRRLRRALACPCGAWQGLAGLRRVTVGAYPCAEFGCAEFGVGARVRCRVRVRVGVRD